MTKDKFQIWLTKLKNSGKTNEEVNKILSDVAKYSGLAIYEAIMLTLSEKDIAEVEKNEKEKDARIKLEQIFTAKTGMRIDELVAKVQEYFMQY